ncbi:MAG: type I 3-dehydroquinate dehydratase [Thermodesulfobacteriota bacterium]|nr:MAG: type I 3-dehydroquinate dehydratase [Thermodesulfobacteriota bacterium]
MKLGGVTLGSGPTTAGVIVEGREKAAAKRAARAGADILELRADTFRDASADAMETIIRELKKLGKPLLLTIRSRKEGGLRHIPDKKREALYLALAALVDAVDIELSSSAILKNVVESARGNNKKVIISYHNFKATPGNGRLQDIIARARGMGADVVKIAAFARGPEDLKRLGSLLAGQDDLIVIAMGEYGKASRVFFPMLGSLLTYGSVTASTAPGQMTLREIKREFLRYGFGK